MMNKKVLFIGIGFYDYEKSIKQEFEKLNFKVDYFSEVPPNSLIYRFYSRKHNIKKLDEIRNRFTISIANKCDDNYDVIFIIKGEYLSKEALEIIKKKNTKAKFVLYLWDSIKRINNIESKFHYFDKIFSFDRLDCLANSKLIFNPLFFRNEYIASNQYRNVILYDVYHLGWYHSDRLRLIKKMNQYFESNNIRTKMILFTGLFSYFFQSIFGGELKNNRKYLIFNSISAEQNFNNIISAKSTLDIAHAEQSGLTMRTIELLGVQRKIITTNSDIVNYDFYHPNNVLIIDREKPTLSKDFFKSDYFPISMEIISKYSITNWLKRMID